MIDRGLQIAFRLFAPPSALYAGGSGGDRLALLDAARALAAIAVLLWHYQLFYFAPGGYESPPDLASREPLYALLMPFYAAGLYAVEIFWMISGFVFANVYYARPATTREFFVNRFARLYPLHLLTLCVVAVLQAVAFVTVGTTLLVPNNDAYHFFLHLVFASNWGFERGNSFNAPIWSVSVEVLIYCLFWATRRWLARFGVVGPLVAAAILLGLNRFAPGNPIFHCGYYFFFGTALSIASAALSRSDGLLASAIGALLVAGIVGFYSGSISLVQLLGLPGMFGGAIVALASLERFLQPPAQSVLSKLGDTTYGMYLWHVPVQLTLILLLGSGGTVAALAASPWFLLLFIGSTIVIARLGFVFYEHPARRWIRRLNHRRPGTDAVEITAP